MMLLTFEVQFSGTCLLRKRELGRILLFSHLLEVFESISVFGGPAHVRRDFSITLHDFA